MDKLVTEETTTVSIWKTDFDTKIIAETRVSQTLSRKLEDE